MSDSDSDSSSQRSDRETGEINHVYQNLGFQEEEPIQDGKIK